MIRGYTKCEIGEFFILDQGCKGTRGHNAKLYKIRSNKDVMKHFFSRRVVERWNNLEQHVVDALNIISYKNKLKHIRETRMGFYWSPLNHMSLTCGLTTVEATPGKEPGKEVKFYLTPHLYNKQTWICNKAVWYQTEWLKKGNISVKYSQPVHRRMNKLQTAQQNYIIVFWKTEKG